MNSFASRTSVIGFRVIVKDHEDERTCLMVRISVLAAYIEIKYATSGVAQISGGLV